MRLLQDLGALRREIKQYPSQGGNQGCPAALAPSVLKVPQLKVEMIEVGARRARRDR